MSGEQPTLRVADRVEISLPLRRKAVLEISPSGFRHVTRRTARWCRRRSAQKTAWASSDAASIPGMLPKVQYMFVSASICDSLCTPRDYFSTVAQ